MDFNELVKQNRSYRKFDNNYRLSREILTELVKLARQTASAANRQPLKYFLSCDKDTNDKIFTTLNWAGYLEDWEGPDIEERPSGYIVILGDKEISEEYFCDPGIAMQTMLLGAVNKGLGGCIFASIDREELRKTLNLKEKFKILYVLALGKPTEEVKLEEIENNYKYWRDEQEVHHVPKRPLEELIIN